MIVYMEKRRSGLVYRALSAFIAVSFIFCSVIPGPGFAQSIAMLNLPLPGAMVTISLPFVPVLLKGMTINPDDPLKFNFIVDSGNTDFDKAQVEEESQKLIKYFLASMTVPKDDLWVNLSPYENDRIIPEELGRTELGRDLLAQDYILKQLTASLMYPEDELGKEFWKRIYEKAQAQYGTTDIPVDTFNKVWILPEQATVYENGNTVYVVNSKMKVMLDSDYQAMMQKTNSVGASLADAHDKNAIDISEQAQGQSLQKYSEIVREIILPEIEKEVNEGKNFAPLRQIYHSLILAKWYKETIKNSLLSEVYVDQNKTAGVELDDKAFKEEIYEQYMQAYKKGGFGFKIHSLIVNGYTIYRPASDVIGSGGQVIMSPWVGRVENGQFDYNGKLQDINELESVKIDPSTGYPKDGLVRNQQWVLEDTGIDEEGAYIKASIDAADHPDILEHFGRSKLTMTIHISGEDIFYDVEVENLDNKKVYNAVGLHEYGISTNRFTTLELNAKSVLDADEKGIPSGGRIALDSPEQEHLNFNDGNIVAAGLVDRTYTDVETDDQGRWQAIVTDAERRIRRTYLVDGEMFQHPHIWSGNTGSYADITSVEFLTDAPNGLNRIRGDQISIQDAYWHELRRSKDESWTLYELARIFGNDGVADEIFKANPIGVIYSEHNGKIIAGTIVSTIAGFVWWVMKKDGGYVLESNSQTSESDGITVHSGWSYDGPGEIVGIGSEVSGTQETPVYYVKGHYDKSDDVDSSMLGKAIPVALIGALQEAMVSAANGKVVDTAGDIGFVDQMMKMVMNNPEITIGAAVVSAAAVGIAYYFGRTRTLNDRIRTMNIDRQVKEVVLKNLEYLRLKFNENIAVEHTERSVQGQEWYISFVTESTRELFIGEKTLGEAGLIDHQEDNSDIINGFAYEYVTYTITRGLNEKKLIEFIESLTSQNVEEKINQLKSKDSSKLTEPDVGGIDMNDIEVERTGSGVEIQFAPDSFDPLLKMGIDGFVPVIINVTPVNNIMMLLGLEPKREEDDIELSKATIE